MKKLSSFFVACALALLANAAQAQTPPPVYTGCSSSSCWADTGERRGIAFGNSNSQAACEAEGQRANEYANYYRSQPQTPDSNNLTLYWDSYADGIFVGFYPSYPNP